MFLMLDHTKLYIKKIHYIYAELAGHVHKLDVKLQGLCRSGFSLFAVRIDQQHFAKTKMGYISLPSNLNVIIGITSYHCVIFASGDIAWCNKNNSEWVFVFFSKKKKLFF